MCNPLQSWVTLVSHTELELLTGGGCLENRDVLDDGDVAAAIARRVIRSALKGNLAAVKEITDRIEGKPRQAIDFAAEDQSNFNFTVRFVKSDGNGYPAPEDACESCGGLRQRQYRPRELSGVRRKSNPQMIQASAAYLLANVSKEVVSRYFTEYPVEMRQLSAIH